MATGTLHPIRARSHLLQLLGEELITILPFLALMALFSKRFGASRKTAIVGAWLVSAALFGLAHLPTYGWNVVQCLAIIGTARLVLTLPWIMTKNLWVSTGAHIINDWTLFGLGLLFVPTGVGVVQQLGLLGDYGVGIVLTLIISAVLTMLATVGAFLLVKRWTGKRP